MTTFGGVMVQVAALGWLVVAPGEAAEVTRGETVLSPEFAQAEERGRWSQAPFAVWQEGPEGRQVLRVTVPADQAKDGHMVSRRFDLTRYRGCRVLFECRAKADGVSKPLASYLGTKFMLHYQTPAAGPRWINENNVYGTFDWKRLSFVEVVAADAGPAELSLGLQGSSGTVWFDQIKVTVLALPRPPRPQPPANPGPVFKGHHLPRLRGVMSPNKFRDEDLRVLGQEWGANVIRWQMTRNWGATGTERDLGEYDRWMDGKLAELDQALESCRRYGIKVVVDVHSPPGGRYANSDMAMFFEPKYQDHFVALWEKIARRYRGNQVIWGYDLVNEPVQAQPSPAGVADYLGTQVRAAKAIRKIDADMPIFIESAQWDSAGGFRDLDPVDVPNVIYQVHMYDPGQFTHQGVHGSQVGVKYPGSIGGVEYDKERLRRVLAPVREFQRAYNVHIYVGEFSAIRWAPGAADYLRDCLDLFEEYDWDWTYHAYREWSGWSLEHSNDQKDEQPARQPTDRKQLLLSWFAKNRKPF